MTEEKTFENMTRAEKRRTWKLLNKKDDYEASGFWDISSYIGAKFRNSKYMPHIGKKEKGIING